MAAALEVDCERVMAPTGRVLLDTNLRIGFLVAEPVFPT